METTETTPATEAKEQFVIDSRERVDWYLRKLANLEAEESRIKAQAQVMLRQIESDRNSLVQHFQPQVENFVRSELEATRAKRKSIAFFHGTVGFRTVPKKLVIENEADAQTTARAVFPAAFHKVETEKFDKWAFLGYAGERLEEHGELLPGVKLTEAREELSPRRRARRALERGKEVPELPRTEEKKRWYFVQKSFNHPYFAVLSKVFYAFDDKYLYERSGKRTPRESTFRTWYDSETSAVGTYYSQVGRWIKSHERDIAQYRKLEKGLGDKLNALIDAEHGGAGEEEGDA